MRPLGYLGIVVYFTVVSTVGIAGSISAIKNGQFGKSSSENVRIWVAGKAYGPIARDEYWHFDSSQFATRTYTDDENDYVEALNTCYGLLQVVLVCYETNEYPEHGEERFWAAVEKEQELMRQEALARNPPQK